MINNASFVQQFVEKYRDKARPLDFALYSRL